MAKKWVYLARNGKSEYAKVLGHDPELAEMKVMFGGKGAGLVEMTASGAPVPPSFTITTEACVEYMKDGEFPDGMWEQSLAALKDIEAQTGKQFGDVSNPLLVSVRSGADGEELQRMEIGEVEVLVLEQAGDLDGDGSDEIALTFSSGDWDPQRPTTVSVLSAGDGSVAWSRTEEDARFGTSLAPAPDANQDGTPELLLGWPSSTEAAGRALLVSGEDGATLRVFEAPSGATRSVSYFDITHTRSSPSSFA